MSPLHRRIARLSLALTCAAAGVPALAQQPVTDKIQVNTSTPAGGVPDVAADGAGNFIVVWSGRDDVATASSGVFGQRFDAAGNRVGGEFQVNTITTGRQDAARVAMAATGEFVVVWTEGPPGTPSALHGRLFDAAGAPAGPEFQVNASTAEVRNPAVAADPRGGFVVAWERFDSLAERDVFARRYDASASPAGAEFPVNVQTAGLQLRPAVGVDAGGGFVVTWLGAAPGDPYYKAWLRRFGGNGAPLGGDALIDPSLAYALQVAVAPGGDFLATWGRDGASLWGRAFDGAGVPVGPAFRIDRDFSGYEYVGAGMAASPGADGTFVVAWERSDYYDENYFNFRIVGKSFDHRGQPVSSEFAVRPTLDYPAFGGPRVATSGPGHSIVTWSEPGGVYFRLFGGGLLIGQVTDAVSSAPIAGAEVGVGATMVTTDGAGLYTAVLDAGPHDITVTRHGYASAFAAGVPTPIGATTVHDFALTPVPALEAGGHALDDSGAGGNGNGVVDANERFLISLSLANTGAGAATGVSAVLGSSTPGVTILQPNATYPHIAAGGTAAGTAFEAATSPSFPRAASIALTLTVSTAQGPFSVGFTIPTGSPGHLGYLATGPVEIPDRSRTPGVLTIPVSGFEGPVTDVILRLHVTHPNVEQLSLIGLVAPDGTRVWVYANFRSGQLNGANLGTDCPASVDDTSFSDASANEIGLAYAPYVGSYQPDFPLSAFVGKSGAAVNGDWRVEVTDSGGPVGASSTGRIECARLVLDGYGAQTGGYQEVAVAGVVTDGGTGAPLAGATVSTTSGFSTTTGADGSYTLNVLPGTFDVTASAAGHAEVRVAGVTAVAGSTQTVDFALPSVFLAPSSVVVEDGGAGGNGNGVADANERFALSVTLANQGGSAATGVSATLSTATPGVTVLQGASAYADIAPGASAANLTPFDLQTAADFAAGTAIALQLAVSTDQGPVTIPISLPSGQAVGPPAAFDATGPVDIDGDPVNGARLDIGVSGQPTRAGRIALAVHVKHPFPNRLTLTLEGPDGTVVPLVDRIATQPPPGVDFGTDCPADANDTTFDDTALLWIGAAPPPRVGVFRPEQALAAFAGKNPNGVWKLRGSNQPSTATPVGTLECARLLVYDYASGDVAPPPDRIFADGFDSGDLSAWTAVSTDNGDVRASAEGALAGSAYGLETVVDDTQALHVRDATPDDERRYRARFYFDPNGFDPGEAAGHFRVNLFMALDETPVRRVLQIVLRRQGGVYSLRGRVILDDETRAETPFVTITDAPHVVELDWIRASAPGANDGSFEMWIDGVPTPPLTGLDNDLYGVDLARLGAMVVKPGASGTIYFDRFDSRRESYIGP